MNCNKGCVGGGGQVLMPMADMKTILQNRHASLLKKDTTEKIPYPYKNEYIKDLYDDYINDKNREILFHTKHRNLSYLLRKKTK